ncbi:guanine nucleotide-binding protein G(i) subunit alpha-2-like protein [Aphelenchoides avenae]|nr:guanine nucleotide-binding protein G(i) subunit alpha-2-like protein [Aphelenchus avenae]
MGNASAHRRHSLIRHRRQQLPEIVVTDMSDSPRHARRISNRIDSLLEEEKPVLDNEIKLLLLGPSESGKSTLLKQTKIMYLRGFNDAERRAFRWTIYRNVVQAIDQLMNGIDLLRLKTCDDYFVMLIELTRRYASQKSSVEDGTFPKELRATVNSLWELPIMQHAYERRSKFHLLDCAQRFLDGVDRLSDENYMPTEDDILSCYAATDGVDELRYTYRNRDFRGHRLVDVGGLKVVRRKWLSVFEGVNAVTFFAALSEYDQVLPEDRNSNRLASAVNLFGEIGNNPLFVKASVFLFLNKTDIFEQKLKQVSLKTCFPSYKFKHDYKNASQYVIRKFEEQIVIPNKNIYAHLVCLRKRDDTKTIMDNIANGLIAIH